MTISHQKYHSQPLSSFPFLQPAEGAGGGGGGGGTSAIVEVGCVGGRVCVCVEGDGVEIE